MKYNYVYGDDIWGEYPDIFIGIERITPEIAEEMLGTNVHNRDMKRLSYASDMRDDKWVLNGSSIVFAKDGTLLDGQNRLAACVASGKPFITIVVRGVENESQESMDIGCTRTLADALKLRGYPNYKSLAAVVPAIARADEIGSLESAFYHRGASFNFTRRQLIDYVERNYSEMQLDKVARYAKATATKREPTSMWGAIIREMMKSGEEDTVAFLNQVRGVTTPSDQVFELVKKLNKNRDASVGENQRVVAAWIIKTWNAWMKNIPINSNTLRLRLGGARPETFPTVYVV